eukprot:Rhum_TRINITY_DN14316_c29_g1::Rhum_TRINITY_DN14316_c29_g1_i1::g.82628::m.82628
MPKRVRLEICSNSPLTLSCVTLPALAVKSLCFLFFLGVLTSAFLLGKQVEAQVTEGQELAELAARMDAATTCTVVSRPREVESQKMVVGTAVPDPKGCLSSSCTTHYRAWVRVRYVALVPEPGSPPSVEEVEGFAWSHIDSAWELGEATPAEFLRRFGIVGHKVPCWYNGDAPEEVRLWDTRASKLCPSCPEFWGPLTGLCVGVCLLLFCCVARLSVTEAVAEELCIDYSNGSRKKLTIDEERTAQEEHARKKAEALEKIEARKKAREAGIPLSALGSSGADDGDDDDGGG